MVHLGLPLLEQRDSVVLYSVSLEDQELCPVCAFSTYFTKVKSAIFEVFILLTNFLADSCFS